MDRLNPDQLRKIRNEEDDPRVRERILAVHMVLNKGMTHAVAADNMMRSERWVAGWIARYLEGGIDALRDRPRAGRPPAVKLPVIRDIISRIKDRVTPARVVQAIYDATGTEFHVTHVRRLMHALRQSAKKPRHVHVNRASEEDVTDWRRWAFPQLIRLEQEGFKIFVQDEAMMVHGATGGEPKYWSTIGEPIVLPYGGGTRKRAVVYGALSTNGQQMFRVYDDFDAETFVKYLDALHKKFGKIAVIVDRASQHTADVVVEYLRDNKEVHLFELPTGSPYLNAVEEAWHQAKRKIVSSEYYESMEDMRRAISAYFRSVRYKLDVWKFLCRKAPEACTNF